MKERCYADDGERQKHMNSLCQTELDACKGSLISERADKKRLSGSMVFFLNLAPPFFPAFVACSFDS